MTASDGQLSSYLAIKGALNDLPGLFGLGFVGCADGEFGTH